MQLRVIGPLGAECRGGKTRPRFGLVERNVAGLSPAAGLPDLSPTERNRAPTAG